MGPLRKELQHYVAGFSIAPIVHSVPDGFFVIRASMGMTSYSLRYSVFAGSKQITESRAKLHSDEVGRIPVVPPLQAMPG